MIIKKFFFITIMILGAFSAMSQGTPGDGGSGGGNTQPGGGFDPGTGNEPPPTGGVPVDGGLSLLLAAGVGYGVRKAYNSRKHKF